MQQIYYPRWNRWNDGKFVQKKQSLIKPAHYKCSNSAGCSDIQNNISFPGFHVHSKMDSTQQEQPSRSDKVYPSTPGCTMQIKKRKYISRYHHCAYRYHQNQNDQQNVCDNDNDSVRVILSSEYPTESFPVPYQMNDNTNKQQYPTPFMQKAFRPAERKPASA